MVKDIRIILAVSENLVFNKNTSMSVYKTAYYIHAPKSYAGFFILLFNYKPVYI